MVVQRPRWKGPALGVVDLAQEQEARTIAESHVRGESVSAVADLKHTLRLHRIGDDGGPTVQPYHRSIRLKRVFVIALQRGVLFIFDQVAIPRYQYVDFRSHKTTKGILG
jgi:hypothetical protein